MDKEYIPLYLKVEDTADCIAGSERRRLETLLCHRKRSTRRTRSMTPPTTPPAIAALGVDVDPVMADLGMVVDPLVADLGVSVDVDPVMADLDVGVDPL